MPSNLDYLISLYSKHYFLEGLREFTATHPALNSINRVNNAQSNVLSLLVLLMSSFMFFSSQIISNIFLTMNKLNALSLVTIIAWQLYRSIALKGLFE